MAKKRKIRKRKVCSKAQNVCIDCCVKQTRRRAGIERNSVVGLINIFKAIVKITQEAKRHCSGCERTLSLIRIVFKDCLGIYVGLAFFTSKRLL